jgi:hypothetical protein
LTPVQRCWIDPTLERVRAAHASVDENAVAGITTDPDAPAGSLVVDVIIISTREDRGEPVNRPASPGT